jgi:hypothetical protein
MIIPPEEYSDYESIWVDFDKPTCFYSYLEFDKEGNVIGMAEPEISITTTSYDDFPYIVEPYEPQFRELNTELDQRIYDLEVECEYIVFELNGVKNSLSNELEYIQSCLLDTILDYKRSVDSAIKTVYLEHVATFDQYLDLKAKMIQINDRFVLLNKSILIEDLNAQCLHFKKQVLSLDFEIENVYNNLTIKVSNLSPKK